MTRQELLEYSALDALGLLDEYEAELYTRSFHYATAAVQDEVLRLQAEIANDESLISNELPDQSLRERVLRAVADAIEREAAQLAPLATIGRSQKLAAAAERRRGVLGASGQFWRAAAFALCAGIIVVAYFWASAAQTGNEIAKLALGNLTQAQLEELIGPSVKKYLFDPTAKQVYFSAQPRAGSAHAKLYISEGEGDAFLVFENLPHSDTAVYVLTVKNERGETETVHQFASTGRVSGTAIKLTLAIAQLQDATWVISDASGTLLASITT